MRNVSLSAGSLGLQLPLTLFAIIPALDALGVLKIVTAVGSLVQNSPNLITTALKEEILGLHTICLRDILPGT